MHLCRGTERQNPTSAGTHSLNEPKCRAVFGGLLLRFLGDNGPHPNSCSSFCPQEGVASAILFLSHDLRMSLSDANPSQKAWTATKESEFPSAQLLPETPVRPLISS